jgi:hypothetical protein
LSLLKLATNDGRFFEIPATAVAANPGKNAAYHCKVEEGTHERLDSPKSFRIEYAPFAFKNKPTHPNRVHRLKKQFGN